MAFSPGHVCGPADIPLEGVPMVCEGISLEGLALDAREGFLLSRIDGRTSVKHLFAITGLGREETLALLTGLHEKGLVTWHHAPTKPKREPTLPPTPPKTKPGTAAPAADREDIFAQAETLYRRRDRMNHYEMLGIEPGATSRAVKKAFLQRSKQFHPDRFFRRGDPETRAKLQEVFKQVNLAYRTLMDPVQRGEYDAGLAQTAKSAPPPVEEEELTAGPRPAAAPEPTPPPSGPKLKLEFGKSSLLTRMEEKMREAEAKAPASDSRKQAERLFQLGLTEMRKKNLKSAEVNLKLALQFDPNNSRYLAEFERLRELETSLQAEIAFENGQEAENFKDYDKAIRLYGEALRIHPENPLWLYQLAKVVYHHQKNFDRVRALLLKAIEQKKGDPEIHFLLGQAYQGLGQKRPAMIQMEKVLEYDPKHKAAAKELKALKRG